MKAVTAVSKKLKQWEKWAICYFTITVLLLFFCYAEIYTKSSFTITDTFMCLISHEYEFLSCVIFFWNVKLSTPENIKNGHHNPHQMIIYSVSLTSFLCKCFFRSHGKIIKKQKCLEPIRILKSFIQR